MSVSPHFQQQIELAVAKLGGDVKASPDRVKGTVSWDVDIPFMKGVPIHVRVFPPTNPDELPDFMVLTDDGVPYDYMEYEKFGMQPALKKGENPAYELLAWIFKGVGSVHESRFETFCQTNERLAFEHAVSLCNICDTTTNRRVQYFVNESASCVALQIPLFASNSEGINRRLENAIILYEKLGGIPLGDEEYRLHANFSYSCQLLVGAAEPLVLLSEAASVTSSSSVMTGFLEAGLDLKKELPTFSTALASGQSFLDFLPSVEQFVERRVQTWLHWLEMVLAMSNYFGDPVEINTFPIDTAGNPLLRTAVFIVTDDATQLSITVNVQYLAMDKIPSVEVASAHHCLAGDGQPIRIRVTFSEEAKKCIAGNGITAVDPIRVAEESNTFLENSFAKIHRVCSESSKS